MSTRAIADVPFAHLATGALMLDLFLPDGLDRPPLVMYIHGGAWKTGNRKQCLLKWLAEYGYAVASIDYRKSQQAIFPAQIFDCKGAVRWLRAHEAEYGYDAARIGVAGASAGGHLAVLLGTSAHVRELEGDVGGNLEQPSRVQAVVDYYGPTDFILRAHTQPARMAPPDSSGYCLLGGLVRDNEALAKLASGAWHVTAEAAPLLVFHGTEDQTVLLDQSERICEAYRALGLEATLRLVPGGAHGGPAFHTSERLALVREFFDRHLKSR